MSTRTKIPVLVLCSLVLLSLLALGGCSLLGGGTKVQVDSLFVMCDGGLLMGAYACMENTGSPNAGEVTYSLVYFTTANLTLGQYTVIYEGGPISFEGQRVKIEEIKWKEIEEYLISAHVSLPVASGQLAVIPFRDLVESGEKELLPNGMTVPPGNEVFVPSFDKNESNNVSGDATAFTVGDKVAGAIFPTTDVDWYSFSADAANRYNISFLNPANAHAYCTLELYADPAGAALATASMGSQYSQDIISAWTPPTTGTYYLKITTSDLPVVYEINVAVI